MSDLSRYAVDWARLCESWEKACETAMQDAYDDDNRDLYLFAATLRGQIASGRSVMVSQVTVDMKMGEREILDK